MIVRLPGALSAAVVTATAALVATTVVAAARATCSGFLTLRKRDRTVYYPLDMAPALIYWLGQKSEVFFCSLTAMTLAVVVAVAIVAVQTCLSLSFYPHRLVSSPATPSKCSYLNDNTLMHAPTHCSDALCLCTL